MTQQERIAAIAAKHAAICASKSYDTDFLSFLTPHFTAAMTEYESLITAPEVLHGYCLRNLRDAQIAHLFGDRMTEIQNDRANWRSIAESKDAILKECAKEIDALQAECSRLKAIYDSAQSAVVEAEIKLSELRARLTQAEGDTARLGLLERAYIHSPAYPGADWGVVLPGRETAFGPTLRTATDAAQSAQTGS